MTAQWILVSVLGCLFGRRIFSHLRSLRVISDETLAQARRIIVPIGVLTTFGMRNHPRAELSLLLLLHFAPFFLMIHNQFSRQRRLRGQILAFLDELVLKMRAGRSLREALKEVPTRGFSSIDLREMPGLICFPEKSTAFPLLPEAQTLLDELRKMDQSRTRVIERLRAYRQKEKMAVRFRQRSSQITNQVRAQALVCSFLYFALLIWVLHGDFRQIGSSPVLFSLALYVFGLAGMAWVTRSFKWKF